MTDKMVVLSTAGSQAEAARIAEELVERRLAACVNVIGRIQSFYRWENKLQRAEEYLMIIKTNEELVEKLHKAVEELNSYDLPEFVTLAVKGGSPEYMKWINECVG